jgi:hypothetical protein
MVFHLTSIQCAYYDALSPSHWSLASSVTDFHSFDDYWVYERSAYEILSVLTELEASKDFKFIVVTPEDESPDLYTTRYFKFSKIFQFMSVITITVTPLKASGVRPTENDNHMSPAKTGFAEVSIRSCSASVFPAFVPLGFILGLLFFWVPFPDFGANERYAKELKAAIDRKLNERTGRYVKELKDAIDQKLNSKRAPGGVVKSSSSRRSAEAATATTTATTTAFDGAAFFLSFIVVPLFALVSYILFT